LDEGALPLKVYRKEQCSVTVFVFGGRKTSRNCHSVSDAPSDSETETVFL